MEKVYPNLMIGNLECLRDMVHVFDLSSLLYDSEVKVGLYQSDPKSPVTRLSLYFPDFQVVFEGDGIMDIIPNEALYRFKFNKLDMVFDTHCYYRFGRALQVLFGEEIALKYNFYLRSAQIYIPRKKID